MKLLITLFRKLVKPVAIVKYLFFPFMIANAASTDITTIIGADQIITAQAQTEEGSWVGTNNGLWHISTNGKHVCHITTANSVLPSNHITGVCITAQGDVYASTDKGLLHFDGYTYTSITTENAKLPTNNISGIVCDKSGYLWLSTNTSGLVLMKGFKAWQFNSQNSILTSNHVTNMVNDTNGDVLVTLDNNTVVSITFEGMQIVEQPILPDVIATKN